jgi:MoxR-like ATPase
VQAMAPAVLPHRLQPVGAAGPGAADEVVADVLSRVPAR